MLIESLFTLDSNRLDCLEACITRPEISKKPNLLTKDEIEKTSTYDRILSLHGKSMKDLKIERHEIKSKDEISRLR